MQEDHTPSKFQIGRDDEEPDAIMQTELQELKIEKLSQRVMLLTILIPCMIGIIIIISYLDIKGRVIRSQDTGTIGVQKLSKDLESKFSSLSLEQAKLKDVYAKKMPSLEKNTAFLQTRLKKVQESIKNLKSSKVERNELSRVVETLDEKYSAIPESLQSDMETFKITDDELKTEADALANQLSAMVEAVNQLSEKLTKLQGDISSVSDTKIDKNDLDLALKLKEIGYRQEILEATGSLEKKINFIQKQVDSLKQASVKPSTVQPKPAETEKKSEVVETSPKPASGSIEEQNIE